MSLGSETRLIHLFSVAILPVVLACTILLPCKVYGQQSESVRSNVHLNAIKLGYIPTEIAVDPTTNKLYVANSFSNTVSVIDTTTDKVLRSIIVGTGASDIAVDPSSKKLYVVGKVNNTISVIDTTTDKVVGNIAVGTTTGASDIAVDPSSKKVYLACASNNRICLIDIQSNNLSFLYMRADKIAVDPSSKKCGLDMICRNGGLIGAITNGGFAEYIAVPERNVFKIPDDLDWDVAASLPVTSLTPYHALKEASLKLNEYLLVFGASGNTGMIAVQLGKKMGAKVIAVSKDSWIKTDFGADYIISDYDRVTENVKEITNGKMADVVLNSLGIGTWDSSFGSVGINGRWVAFGGLTGADVKLNIQALYSKQIKLIGSTGGTRKELRELVDTSSKELKVRVWKKFKLEDVKEALQALSAKERDGRILLDINNGS